MLNIYDHLGAIKSIVGRFSKSKIFLSSFSFLFIKFIRSILHYPIHLTLRVCLYNKVHYPLPNDSKEVIRWAFVTVSRGKNKLILLTNGVAKKRLTNIIKNIVRKCFIFKNLNSFSRNDDRWSTIFSLNFFSYKMHVFYAYSYAKKLLLYKNN